MRSVRSKKGWWVFLFAFFLLRQAGSLSADIIALKNGDRLTVDQYEEKEGYIHAAHPALGDINIHKDQVAYIAKQDKKTEEQRPEKKTGAVTWDRRFSAGYDAIRGNTDADNLNTDILFNRNRLWVDEWTLKATANQQYFSKKKVVQQARGNLRYAWSLNKKVYNFYQIGLEHDLFQNIDLRLTPTTGFGYWFSDKDTLKMMTEAGAGYEYEFRRGSKDQGAPVLNLREMFSKKIGNAEIGEDISYIPKINRFEDYRVEAEAFLRFILSQHLAFKFKLGDQYRSRPVVEKKKNDMNFTSAVEWLF